MNDDGGRETDESPAEEAVEKIERDDRPDRFNRYETEDEDAGDQDAGDNHIHRPDIISHKVRYNPTKHARAVENRQQIEREIFVRDVGLDRVVLAVEERGVEAEKADQAAEGEEHVGWLREGGCVD